MEFIQKDGKQITDNLGRPCEIDSDKAHSLVIKKLRNLLVLAERKEYSKLESAVRSITFDPNQSELVSLITSLCEDQPVALVLCSDQDERELEELALGNGDWNESHLDDLRPTTSLSNRERKAERVLSIVERIGKDLKKDIV